MFQSISCGFSTYFVDYCRNTRLSYRNGNGGNYVPCVALIHPLQVNTGEIGSVFHEGIWYWCKRLDGMFDRIQITDDAIIMTMDLCVLSHWAIVPLVVKDFCINMIRSPQCRWSNHDSLLRTMIYARKAKQNGVYIMHYLWSSYTSLIVRLQNW